MINLRVLTNKVIGDTEIMKDFRDLLKSKVGMGGCEGKECFQYAWDNNIRFFDTGWGYHGGENDSYLKDFLKDKTDYVICQKLPLFDGLYQERYGKSSYRMTDEELEKAIRDIFSEQCKRCGVEYFDIYMLHAIFDMQHSSKYNIYDDIDLYKRISSILLKMKAEGKIGHIGFSAHITFERLCLFLNEVDPDNKIFDVAEVSYNALNNIGASVERPSPFVAMHNVMVWDAIGERGIRYLKEKGYFIIDMMPTESGRLLQVSTAPDFIRWNLSLISMNKDIDLILAGTKNPKHMDQIFIAVGEKEDPEPVPDMRVINSGISHCHE